VAELEDEARKLDTERQILRAAAKHSPGRRAGEPLPVRRRPPDRLRGGVASTPRSAHSSTAGTTDATPSPGPNPPTRSSASRSSNNLRHAAL